MILTVVTNEKPSVELHCLLIKFCMNYENFFSSSLGSIKKIVVID